ncbi:response regulator transcription factor [Marvinbryantia formatexigens]|uniref:response regulator transcription factor n=1 Tax=Marvinbryantia formatexigens TaxID=168384 RepID=UPI000318D085|nr:helix-turn-helix domain-containing protein [Marvinbryantia formatexigens]UWO26481.1 response regulator [Marvinbryantia formatexigens DSM 14469]SDF79088.1 two-component system, response regulator YesN [Marvinbryantia formatexigens]
MRLLIVDDQPSVSEGLKKGIAWDNLSVDEVLTAYNALEAREILKTTEIDIMLCDIEMPVENGLQLFRWVKENEIDLLCIFLTSHAEFSYAREGIRLGAFDYIVQPALYPAIEEVVRKAVAEVMKKKGNETIMRQGQVFRKQRASIAANAIRHYLEGNSNYRDIENLTELHVLPDFSLNGYVVMLQIVKWDGRKEVWDAHLLEQTLDNILQEIFAPNNQKAVLAGISEGVFLLLLQSYYKEAITEDSLTRQLMFLGTVCRQFFKCQIACYFSNPGRLYEMAEKWKKLDERREDNVSLQPGVFFVSGDKPKREHVFRLIHTRQWEGLFADGHPRTVEEQAVNLLDSMARRGTLDKQTLLYFYQDYMQLLYTVLKSQNRDISDVFQTMEEMEIYRNGMKSIDDMKKLICFVTIKWQVEPEENDVKAMIKNVMTYVDANLDSAISRNEIAEQVHLNPDYLTRLFKKETGQTLKEYITEQKMKSAQSLLRTTNMPVSFVAAKVGYSNFSHFSTAYKKVMGRTPQEERG